MTKENVLSYQGAPLNCATEDVEETCKNHALRDLDSLNEKMKDRLELSDSKLLRSLLVFLKTQTWVRRSNNMVSGDSILDDEDSLITEEVV